MQSIISNTIIATVGRIGSAAAGVVVTAILSRWLGPTSFGVYTVVLSYGVILQLIADSGLYLTLTREIATQAPEAESTFFARVVSLRVVLLLLVGAGGLVVAWFLPVLQEYITLISIAVVGLGLQSISQLCMGVYQKHGVVWRATLGDSVGRLLQVALLLVVWQRTASVAVALVAFGVSLLGALLVHLYLLPLRYRWRQAINWQQWQALVKISWPLGAMLVLNAIYFRIDTLILSLFRSAAEVGQYGLVYRVIESSLFFPAMLGGLLLPKLTTALHRQHYQRANQYLQQSSILVGVLLGAGCIVLIGFPEVVIQVIGGVEYQAAAALVQVLSVAMGAMFFGQIFGFAVVALSGQRFLLKTYLVLALANLAANWLFIPAFGAIAAAWTTVGTELVAVTCAWWWVRRTTGLHVPWRPLGKVALITAFLLVLRASVLAAYPPLLVGSSVLVGYGLLVYGSRVVRQSDIQLLVTPHAHL